MSIIDKLKDLKDQLPKTKLDERVQKETNNLKDQVQAELRPEDDNTHPGLGPAKEDYILLNTFEVQFAKEDCFIRPEQVFAVARPDYDVINSHEDKEIEITFTSVDAKHYFGKPSEYTNFKTDQDIYDLVDQFNQNPPEWFDFIEIGDDSGSPRLTTRFWGLNITKIKFPEFNTMTEGVMKYYTVTMCYNRKQTYHGEYEDIVE